VQATVQPPTGRWLAQAIVEGKRPELITINMDTFDDLHRSRLYGGESESEIRVILARKGLEVELIHRTSYGFMARCAEAAK